MHSGTLKGESRVFSTSALLTLTVPRAPGELVRGPAGDRAPGRAGHRVRGPARAAPEPAAGLRQLHGRHALGQEAAAARALRGACGRAGACPVPNLRGNEISASWG
jgi:hypothetical protein